MYDLMIEVVEERTSIVNYIYDLSDKTSNARDAKIMRDIAVKIEELHDIESK